MSLLPSITDCHLLDLPKIYFREGNLTAIHSNGEVPFEIARVFYIYDVPGGEDRGAHAHKACKQLIVAASGAFEVELTDGIETKKVLLNRPYFGLLVPEGIWAQEVGFSSGSVCLVFASHEYDESDYIRDFQEYVQYRNASR
jgi:hypothetical protein